VTHSFDGKRLVRLLLNLRTTDNDTLIEQVIRLDDELCELEAEIERAEAEMNQLVYSLYKLTDDEIRLIEQG